jgi:hypothetical protein
MLGEAYRRSGKKGLALENFRQAFKLDRENYYAEYEIKQLQIESKP